MSFENAPVTKGLMLGYALTSILAGVFDIKHYFHLQLVPHLSRHHQYWRLLFHHLVFSSSSDLFVAELLFYHAGVQVERLFGSVKFASFTFVSVLLATIFEFLALVLFHGIGLNHITMGSSPLVFSILYQYARIVPPAYRYRIFGISLTSKSILYLLAIQSAISRLPSTGAVAFIGILVGQTYRSDLANLKAYRLPQTVIRLATRFVLPLVGALRPPRRSNRALPDEPRRGSRNTSLTPHNDEVVTTARPSSSLGTVMPRNHHQQSDMMDRNTAAAAAAAEDRGSTSVMREWVDGLTGRNERPNRGPIRVPTETEIAQLTSMFSNMQRDVIVTALQRSPNIETAVETLLSSPPSAGGV